MQRQTQVLAMVVIWSALAGCTMPPAPQQAIPQQALLDTSRQEGSQQTALDVQVTPPEVVARTDREAQLEERIQELETQLKAVVPVLEAARRMQAAAEHASTCQASSQAWQQWLLAAHTARENFGTPRFLALVNVAAAHEMEARRLSEQVVEYSRLLGGRLCPTSEEPQAPVIQKVKRVRR